MKRRLVAVVLLVLLGAAGPARAAGDMVSPADGEAIRGAISRQLDAFRRDDGAAAFALASPAIQARFGTPQHFMAVVQQGYQPVYRPRDVDFRDIVLFQGHPTQRVMVVGPDGVPVVAYYLMERQPDGRWLIDGCMLMGAGEEAV